MSPTPVWYRKKLEEMSAAELRQVMNDERASGPMRDAAGKRLGEVQEQRDRSERAKADYVRRLRREWSTREPVVKKRGQLDGRSLKHATKNAGWGGSSIVVVWATVKSVTEAYKQVKSSGLGADLWAVVKALHPSEAQVVYACGAAALVFAATLIWKASKE